MGASLGAGSFGDLLRKLRLETGHSQETLAERAGLSARGISDLERGVNRSPQRETVLRLAEALGLAEDARAGFEAAARKSKGGSAKTPAPGHASTPPVPLTALVGRDRDVISLTAILRDPTMRLVTLTGPGGVGKTRLALAVVSELDQMFPDGVIFVPLASLTDASLVFSTVAQSIGMRAEGSRSLAEELAVQLRSIRMLLVLDNFEHLLQAAPALAALLEACSRLTVLATSRARLRVRGEREFPVEPLTLPNPQRLPAADVLAQVPAVALFVERVLEQRPRFTLSDSNAPTVAEICVRLDGLPLALELAAAQSRMFSERALLARLDRRLAVLTDGPRDLPARQQTMRATVAWSYDVLDPGEQTLFRRMAVFAGGFTMEAVEAFFAGNGGLDGVLFETLRALADKSLLRQSEADNGEARFDMLETMREYGLDLLAGSGELEECRRSHAQYCLDLAEQAEKFLRGAEQRIWLARLEIEHDNLRAALRWSIVDNADPALGLRLACALGRFWLMYGYYREGRSWLEQALARSTDVEAGMEAKTLTMVGHLAYWLGDLDQAQTVYERALLLRRNEGDPRQIGMAISHVGNVAFERQDYERAQALYEQSVRLAEQSGDVQGEALALNNLGVIAQIRGDLDQALAAFERCHLIWQEQGDTWSVAVLLNSIGDVASGLGETRRARDCYRKA